MYQTLGLKLTYHPDTDKLDIEARPDAYNRGRVGGASVTINPPPLWAGGCLALDGVRPMLLPSSFAGGAVQLRNFRSCF